MSGQKYFRDPNIITYTHSKLDFDCIETSEKKVKIGEQWKLALDLVKKEVRQTHRHYYWRNLDPYLRTE